MEIRVYPDPVLRKRSSQVESLDSTVEQLVYGMGQVMYQHQGVGLAAPQVGVLHRVIIFDIGQGFTCLLNPRIVDRGGEELLEEGCLSLPEIRVGIKRNSRLVVEGFDLKGREVRFEAEGLLARVIQHELDHLDGLLLIDRLSPLRRRMLSGKLKRLQQERGEAQ